MATNNNDKALNVPHLRFPEFSGEWEKCKLSEVCSFFSGGTPSSSKKEYYDGSIPFIRSGELHINKTELFITEEGLNNSAAKIVEIGDLLLALYGATSGDIAISQINGAINQAILCIRTTQNKKFIESVWKKHVDWLLQTYLQGGQGNLSADIVKNISFYFADISEQIRLAKFISLLDERIATQNKIIEKLQSLIKGLSQQLLSSENYWILYRLDDLAQIKSGYSGTQVGYQTPYKVSRIETISKHCVDIQRIGYVEYIPESYKLNVGDILFSNINSVQYIGNTAYLDKDYGLYHGMNLLRIIPNTTIVRPRFLHLLLCTDWAINHFQTICNKAVSQTSINQTALGKSRFPIPPMSVQQQICSMFELTERKLDNEQKYISCLQQQKWYLLQEMFI